MFSVLICTTDKPGFGGASISSEGVANWLRTNGVKTELLYPDSKITSFKPDIVIGKNYFGYRKIRQELSNLKVPRVYLTSGLKVMSDGLRQYVDVSNTIKETFGPAKKAVEDADHVIANSPYGLETYLRTFKTLEEKISPFIFYDCLFSGASKTHNLLWEQKDIDVLFIASDWSRPVKNFSFARELITSLENKWVGIAGKKAVIAGQKRLVNYGFQGHRKLLDLLLRSKVLVIPSTFDSSPNVLVEAFTCGTNVVLSKNVGTYNWTHQDLICDRCDKKQFLEAIKIGLRRPLNKKVPIDLNLHGREFLKLLREWSK